VTCSRGAENLLGKEVEAMGYLHKMGKRGVFVNINGSTGDVLSPSKGLMEAIFRINYTSRIATRVLLPLKKFKFQTTDQLYKQAKDFPWHKYIQSMNTIAINCRGEHEQINNEMFGNQLLKDAIVDRIREETGNRPNVNINNPDMRLNLNITEKEAIISLDTSNVPLSRRGYRRETVEAPLMESLAASFLYLAGFHKFNQNQEIPKEIIFDPCCGSGTFLIEAAMIATNTPAAFLRHQFGFFKLPGFSHEDWIQFRQKEDSKIIPLERDTIFGTEIDSTTSSAMKSNLKIFTANKSDIGKRIHVYEEPFQNFKPPAIPSMLITNPPYGLRLESENPKKEEKKPKKDEGDPLAVLYRNIGHFMKQKCGKPSKGFILTGNKFLSHEIGLQAKTRHIVWNGGIEARLLEYQIY